MKTLCIFVTHFNPKSDGEMYYKRFKNWQIDDINFTFTSSHKNETQPINLKIATIKFNLDLIDKLIRIIKTSAKKAHILNPEENDAQTGIERQKGTIESIINSLIMKYSMIVEYFDIFDFVTELFIKLLQNHIFYNGNKRTSIISLSAILWEFGYYLKWSINASNKYIQDYEHKIINFIKKLQRTNDNITDYNHHLKTIKQEIKNWIMDRISIAFNFRNE